MSTQLDTREELFAVMEQIAEEREAAKPIVEELVARGAEEEVWDSEIPESWRTAGFVQELSEAAGTMWQSDPVRSLPLQQLALAVAASIAPQTYPSPVQTRLEGMAWKEIGYVHLVQNAYSAALRAYDTAERCFERGDVLSHDATSTQLARAVVLTFMRQLDDALPVIKQSASRLRTFGDQRRLAMADFTRALVHQQRGELQIARTGYEKLLSALHTTDDLHTLATVYNNLGIVYRDLNRPNDAVIALQRAREIYADIGTPVDKTDWCLAGVLLTTGQFAKALPMLRSLRDAFLARAMPEEAGEVALDIAEVLIATNQIAEARALIEQVVAEFRSANLNEQAITALAYLRDLLQTTTQARQAVKHVRSYVQQLRSEPERFFLPLDEKG